MEGEPSDEEVVRAWLMVLERVNRELEKPVNILRLDSVVWQAGVVADVAKAPPSDARSKLVEILISRSIPREKAETIAREFLYRPLR